MKINKGDSMKHGCNHDPLDLTRFLVNLEAQDIEPTDAELDEIEKDCKPNKKEDC
jgi:hypothetical protein